MNIKIRLLRLPPNDHRITGNTDRVRRQLGHRDAAPGHRNTAGHCQPGRVVGNMQVRRNLQVGVGLNKYRQILAFYMNGGVQLAGPVKVTRQAGSAFVAAAPAPLQTCLLAINTDCQPQLLQRNWQHAAADMGVSQQDFALNGRLQQGAGKLALPRDTSLQVLDVRQKAMQDMQIKLSQVKAPTQWLVLRTGVYSALNQQAPLLCSLQLDTGIHCSRLQVCLQLQCAPGEPLPFLFQQQCPLTSIQPDLAVQTGLVLTHLQLAIQPAINTQPVRQPGLQAGQNKLL